MSPAKAPVDRACVYVVYVCTGTYVLVLVSFFRVAKVSYSRIANPVAHPTGSSHQPSDLLVVDSLLVISLHLANSWTATKRGPAELVSRTGVVQC